MGSGWLVIVWRLPHGSSTPRVTVWRSLKRLGAATLTPGAALLPFREDLQEQLGWIAQEIEEIGGDAWVLEVGQLSEAEEARVREQVNSERQAEYLEVAQEAADLSARAADQPPTSRHAGSLSRRLQRIQRRDHYGADGRRDAMRALDDLATQLQGAAPSAVPAGS